MLSFFFFSDWSNLIWFCSLLIVSLFLSLSLSFMFCFKSSISCFNSLFSLKTFLYTSNGTHFGWSSWFDKLSFSKFSFSSSSSLLFSLFSWTLELSSSDYLNIIFNEKIIYKFYHYFRSFNLINYYLFLLLYFFY